MCKIIYIYIYLSTLSHIGMSSLGGCMTKPIGGGADGLSVITQGIFDVVVDPVDQNVFGPAEFAGHAVVIQALQRVFATLQNQEVMIQGIIAARGCNFGIRTGLVEAGMGPGPAPFSGS